MSLFSHFLCDSVSPAYKPALTLLYRKGDFRYNEMTKDIDFSLNPMLFVSLPGELDQLIIHALLYDVCVPHFVSLTGVPAFIVRSCRERRVCPSFCVSHRRTSLYCAVL